MAKIKRDYAIVEREIPLDVQDGHVLNCGRCLDELPAGMSPQEFARQQVIYTQIGFQVICVRHMINILHVDFQGFQLPANTHARKESPLWEPGDVIRTNGMMPMEVVKYDAKRGERGQYLLRDQASGRQDWFDAYPASPFFRAFRAC